MATRALTPVETRDDGGTVQRWRQMAGVVEEADLAARSGRSAPLPARRRGALTNRSSV
jgi:hypothetical protein